LNKNFSEISANFETEKNAYAAQAQQLISSYENLLSHLSYISKYKLLNLKNDLKEEFAKYKNESTNLLNANALKSLMDSFAKFWSYCAPDLFKVDCAEGESQQAEKNLKDALLGLLGQIAAKDASEPALLDEEGLILLVKEAKRNLEYTRDIVQKKEYAGLFMDLTKEFATEAQDMSDYLAEMKPFEIRDIVQTGESVVGSNNSTNAAAVKQDVFGTAVEPDFSVYKFEEHFLNLLDSSAYMCWVLKHNPFGQTT
jgi:hypothetical protein